MPPPPFDTAAVPRITVVSLSFIAGSAKGIRWDYIFLAYFIRARRCSVYSRCHVHFCTVLFDGGMHQVHGRFASALLKAISHLIFVPINSVIMKLQSFTGLWLFGGAETGRNSFCTYRRGDASPLNLKAQRSDIFVQNRGPSCGGLRMPHAWLASVFFFDSIVRYYFSKDTDIPGCVGSKSEIWRLNGRSSLRTI